MKFRTFLAGLCVICTLALSAHAAADYKADSARLDALLVLSGQDNEAALKQLKEFYALFNPDTDYFIRIDTLRAIAGAYVDSGNEKESNLVKAEILKLATARDDKEIIALAKIDEVFQLSDSGKGKLAIDMLDKIAVALKDSNRPENLYRLELSYGAVYHAMSQFDSALKHHLAALTLADKLPRNRAFSKLRQLGTLASLYLTMQNPEQSLVMVSEALGLAAQINSPRIASNLRQTQAMALGDLDRLPEALVAYERSLKTAQEAKLTILEPLILSNIADLYLRLNNFTKAESVARLSLQKAERADDKASILNAKANIGFALGGQGKVSAAMEYLNLVVAHARETGDRADLAATVGEIGRMYERAKMYKEALEYTREQQKLSNELFRSDRAKTVATLQEQFDADQRKKQIELLARENEVKDADIKNNRLQQIVTLLAALITIMVGIFIYMLYRKVKQTNAKLEEVNQQLEFHSVRDPLTGLHNRRSFLEMMKVRTADVAHDRREEDGTSPDCLIIMDIDHFKHINDTWGHSSGDAVLVEVAKRLRTAVRDSDMILRWGGEEFLIYSPKTKPSLLPAMIERVLFSIGATPVMVGRHSIPVTVSAGFISLPFSGLSETECNWEKAMQLADMALYLGKVNGRNRAYGLLSLLIPFELALPELERDFSAAIQQGMVEIIVVNGPSAQSEAKRSPANTSLTSIKPDHK
ncbi:MAG: diguanylate cyclase [Undibacterium sp.]|nr:diguanylate cyclase [Undibacterium sp.]